MYAYRYKVTCRKSLPPNKFQERERDEGGSIPIQTISFVLEIQPKCKLIHFQLVVEKNHLILILTISFSPKYTSFINFFYYYYFIETTSFTKKNKEYKGSPQKSHLSKSFQLSKILRKE